MLPLASIDSLSATGELVAFNVGADDALYMAFALEPLDDRTRSDGASFAITTPSAAQRHRLIAWRDGDTLLDLVVDNEPFDIHEIQPVGDDLLVVCCRSSYRGPDDFDLNGRLYRRDGTRCGEILLGDGIQSVQVTGTGEIWTSYFDEGVFGNFGWERRSGRPDWSRGAGAASCCMRSRRPRGWARSTTVMRSTFKATTTSGCITTANSRSSTCATGSLLRHGVFRSRAVTRSR
ncbi:hypothetical protein [Burkholderia cepacia]|uniref:hypothetical protein n=1 Tax=Burkholderia cepacia TaxID=292 RepID=UPI0012D931E1|nr:hypothetical protein [Burkholderia cepacia]